MKIEKISDAIEFLIREIAGEIQRVDNLASVTREDDRVTQLSVLNEHLARAFHLTQHDWPDWAQSYADEQAESAAWRAGATAAEYQKNQAKTRSLRAPDASAGALSGAI